MIHFTFRVSLFFSVVACFVSQIATAQSVSLPTDRARVRVVSIPDAYNASSPPLKVLRTDTDSPLRAGTAWIWEKDRQEEPSSYYVSMRSKGLNAVRMILFDTWEIEAYTPSASFTPTDWSDPVYRTRQLARMERAVNDASVNGMYVVINSHNKIPNYNAAYNDALWTHVAPYFAGRTHVLYEASNEAMDGIGNNGSMTANASDSAANSPRIQALKATYNIIRNAAPNTHIMVLTPPGINDYATGTGLGNLAAAFASLPGAVDWTKTSVAYHLYNNDSAYGAATNAANLRNLHSRYPGWPSENNFPASVTNSTLGISDTWRSAQFDNDVYVNQTCERLGLGWSMWNINGQAQLDRNWPIMIADANAKGWNWAPDILPAQSPVFTSASSSAFSQNIEGSHQVSAAGGAVTYAAIGLPSGLVLNNSTGIINGTTASAGKFNVSVSATNTVGTTNRTLLLNITPTQDSTIYSEAFATGNTAGWFSYSGGSAGITNTLSNEAAGTTDGRALRLSLTAPNIGWYAGAGIGRPGTPPFSANDLARTFIRGRIQIVGPSSAEFAVSIKSGSNQSLTFSAIASGGNWSDFYAPLSAFSNSGFNFSSSSWEILVVPNASLWGTGNFSLRLDSIEIFRRDDVTDPLLAWRKIYFGSTTATTGLYADNADLDADGMTNFLEYALGSAPNDPKSAALPVAQISGPVFQFTYFRAQSGLSYQVVRSADLITWTSVGVTQAITPVGQAAIATIPLNSGMGTRHLLRLSVSQP